MKTLENPEHAFLILGLYSLPVIGHGKYHRSAINNTCADTELEAARGALRARFARRHAARVDEFDGNGDGELGPLERRRAGA